jgi:hypothetical protein
MLPMSTRNVPFADCQIEMPYDGTLPNTGLGFVKLDATKQTVDRRDE